MKNHVVNWYAFSLGVSNSILEKASTKPSLTVPGMTLSLRDLLDRYIKGGDVTTFTPVYAGDVDMPDIAGMSEMDKIDMSRTLKDGIEKERRRLARAKKSTRFQEMRAGYGPRGSIEDLKKGSASPPVGPTVTDDVSESDIL